MTNNIVKLSGSNAKKGRMPIPVSIAAIANAMARKDREWRSYSDAQERRRKTADLSDDEINKARVTWQANINKKLKPEGYCEITSISVSDTPRRLELEKKQAKLVLTADCHSCAFGKYPVVKIAFTFGFATHEEFDHQVATLKGILIAASRGQEQ